MRTVLVAIGLLLLAGCGSKAGLRPEAGAQLPPVPYGQSYRPDADDLLEPSEQAVPARNIELREDSEERADDPFDLPPE